MQTIAVAAGKKAEWMNHVMMLAEIDNGKDIHKQVKWINAQF
jgi:hypothetical protein